MFGKKKDVRRMEILNMLAEGKITAVEATDILDKMDNDDAVVEVDEAKEQIVVKRKKDYAKKMFRVIVDSSDGDKVRVNIPIALAKGALNATKKSNMKIGGVDMDDYGIDIDEIIKLIDEDLEGEIVSVDSADGDVVRIVID
jgi:hypothetical protein